MSRPPTTCPACAAQLAGGDHYCAACGAPVPAGRAGPGRAQPLLLFLLILLVALFVTSRFLGKASPAVLIAAFAGTIFLGMMRFADGFGVPQLEKAARLVVLLIVLSSGLLVLWLFYLIQIGRLAP